MGWVCSSSSSPLSTRGSELYFWVPSSCREGLCAAETLLIIGKPMIRLDLCSFVHDTFWTQCYSSAITAHPLPLSVNVTSQMLGSSFLSLDCLISSDHPLPNQHPQLGIDIAESIFRPATTKLSALHNPDHSETQVDYLTHLHLYHIVPVVASLVAAYVYYIMYI